MEKHDYVDVQIQSEKSVVDAIFQDPLLDGDLKYSVQVTELTCPMGGEPPLPREVSTANDYFYLFKVLSKTNGATPNSDDAKLQESLPVDLGLTAAEQATRANSRISLNNHQEFRQSDKTSIQTIPDLVFEAQKHVDNIKAIIAADHVDVDKFDEIADDDFLRVVLTPNFTIRFIFSPLFADNFFLQLSTFSKHLFGIDKDYISFTTLNGQVRAFH